MCDCETNPVSLSNFRAIALDSRSNVFKASPNALSKNDKAIEIALVGMGIDRVHTLSLAAADKGTVALKGNIGLIPVEGSIEIGLEGGVLSLTIELTAPFKIGPLTWKFNVGGQTLTLISTPNLQSTGPLGLNWGCIAKCAGGSVMSVVLACLPSLLGGASAFIACVTAKLDGDEAAKFAECIAKNCT